MRSKKKKLKRVPGRVIVVNQAIAMTRKKAAKADPNGYYQVLGLDRRREWSDDEIKKAYWSRAKKLHPDGSSPDPEQFRRVQIAYAVLKDSDARGEYDALDAAKRWLDEDIVTAILGNLLKDQAKEPDAFDLIREELEKIPPPPPSPAFDSFAYYYYVDEDVPSQDVRERWAALVVGAMWEAGKRAEVRLGFTTGDAHVVRKPWGTVLMASGSPDPESAASLIKFLDD